VVFDFLIADPRFGPASRDAMHRAYQAGPLLACEVVWAELRAHFPDDEAFHQTMRLLGLTFDPLGSEAAVLGGALWRAARSMRSPRTHVVADYLIGAHARVQADALLTRDERFYRASFKGLKVVDPTGPR
jgi:hypothetical protein